MHACVIWANLFFWVLTKMSKGEFSKIIRDKIEKNNLLSAKKWTNCYISTYFAASTVGWLTFRPFSKSHKLWSSFYVEIITRTIQKSHETWNIKKYYRIAGSRETANLSRDINHVRWSLKVDFFGNLYLELPKVLSCAPYPIF